MADPAKYRTVSFTSLEKKAAGHKTGRYTKTFTLSHFGPGELDAHIAKLRETQKRENDRFRGEQRRRREAPEAEQEEQADGQSAEEPNALDAASIGEFDADTPVATRAPAQPTRRGGASSKARGARRYPSPPSASSRISLILDRGTGNSTALIGSSKQGKSTCMMELYRQNYADPDIVSVLFAANPQLAMYADRDLVVSPVYEPRVIKLAHAINRKTKNAYEFCMLLDDIVDKRDDNVLKQLILTLRNSRISSIVCLQFTNLLAKVARANVNNLLLFGFNSDEAIELVCKQFLAGHLRELGVPPSEWTSYYREATRDHGFIYIHPSSGAVSYHRLRGA